MLALLHEAPPQPVAMQRARGSVRASYRVTAGATRLATLHQAGCLKLRFPARTSPAADCVLVNTAGGLAGGDRLDASIELGDGAALTLTTQACERVYRSTGADATFAARLALGPGSDLAWLPQETILFDGGRLKRQLDVAAHEDARFVLSESVVLGREAMGESVASGLLADSWRVRVGGALVYADELKLDGDIASLLPRAACLAGNRAFATLLARRPDIEAALGPVRAAVGPFGGASFVGGCLAVRIVAADGLDLRRRLAAIVPLLAGRPLPRLWSL